MNRSMIEVHAPDGHKYRLSQHGEIEGFPVGSILINRTPQVIGESIARFAHQSDRSDISAMIFAALSGSLVTIAGAAVLFWLGWI